MEKEKLTDISELIQLMFVGLIGANKEIERKLKEFHEKNNKLGYNFLFLENLLHRPLSISRLEDKNFERNFDGQLTKTWEVSPFIQRLAQRSLVMIRPEDANEANWKDLYKPSTDKNIIQANILIKMKNTLYTRYMYEYWLKVLEEKEETKRKNKKQKVEKICNHRLEFSDFDESDKQFFALAPRYVKDIKDIMENIKKAEGGSKFDNMSKMSFHILHGLLWPQIQHLKGKGSGFFIPIASSQVFYGVIFICLPHFEWNKDKNKIEQLISELLRCIKRHYVPALALIHEHFYEKLLYHEIKKITGQKTLTGNEKIQLLSKPFPLSLYDPKTGEDLTDTETILYEGFVCRNPTCEICFKCQYFGWEEVSDNVVEKYLHKLTQDRKILGEVEYIERSLLFRNRLYTDPLMLDILEDFLKPSKAKLKREGDLLPSVLIEAPPGAGKEDIPNILRVFTDCYNRGKIYSLNMASIKPDAIVPVAMVGGEFTWERSIYSKAKHERDGIPRDVILLGIFQQIRDRIHIEFQEFFSSVEEDGLIPRAQNYLNYLNNGISNALNGKRYKLAEQLRKKREYLKKVNKELDKWVGELLGAGELLGKEEFKRKIEKINNKQRIVELVEKRKEHEERIKEKQEKKEEFEYLIKEKLDELKTLRDEQREELKKGINKFLEKLKSEEKLIIKELFGRFPTIVLDELNSMNIESQGVLLRFLEKAEIMPIGSYEDELWINGKANKDYREFLTDFLIVGLMNEDPEEITRERAIRFLKQKDSYISGLLGDMLYEYIIKTRRLRPDLRQRMMRNGKLKLPELEKRRADIPSIFYMILDGTKKDFFQDSEVRISMDALEYLIRPDLKWNENVRLLQTLTKKVAEIVYEDYEERREKEEIPTIKKKIITKYNEETKEEIKKIELIIIREKHIKETMEEIGMLKESGIDVRNKFEEIE